MEIQQSIVRIGILFIAMMTSTSLFSQSRGKTKLGDHFELKLPKKFEFVEQYEGDYFKGLISWKGDTVRAFESDELFIQAILHIDQEVFELKSAEEFNTESEPILELKESRNVSFITVKNRLIVSDFGPKSLKGEVPVEIFCYDYDTKRSLVINSSSTIGNWNKNLELVKKKFARKLCKAVKKMS